MESTSFISFDFFMQKLKIICICFNIDGETFQLLYYWQNCMILYLFTLFFLFLSLFHLFCEQTNLYLLIFRTIKLFCSDQSFKDTVVNFLKWSYVASPLTLFLLAPPAYISTKVLVWGCEIIWIFLTPKALPLCLL